VSKLMTLTVSQDGETRVVAVDGICDVYTSPKLRDQLRELVAASPAPIRVDFRGCPHLDSTAIGVMIGILKRMREVGDGELSVVASERICRVWEVTGIYRLIPCSREVPDAA
jgi:anti-sigma B factor antagonist